MFFQFDGLETATTERPLNLLAGILLFCALPLIILPIARIAAWLGGKAAIAMTLTLLIVVTLGTASLSRSVAGQVLGKSEILEVANLGLNPGVVHRLRITVSLDTTGRNAVPESVAARRARGPHVNPPKLAVDVVFCEVGARLFDSVRPGDRIELYTLNVGPLRFAQPVAEPWWHIGRGLLPHFLSWSSDTGPITSVRALVTEVRTIRDAYVFSSNTGGSGTAWHVTLPQPYDEVRFRFATARGAEILTLDRVDAGSAGALIPGTSLEVRYPADEPRAARLVIGRRDYASHNARVFWSGLIIVVLIGAFVLTLLERARRRISVRVATLVQSRSERAARAQDNSSSPKPPT